MNASMLNAKALLLIAGVAMLVPLGVGVAYATSSGGDSSGRATETNLDKAKSVALQQVEGRLTGSEIGDEEGAYQIEITRSYGSQVDGNLDKNFNVLGTPTDNEDRDGQDPAMTTESDAAIGSCTTVTRGSAETRRSALLPVPSDSARGVGIRRDPGKRQDRLSGRLVLAPFALVTRGVRT